MAEYNFYIQPYTKQGTAYVAGTKYDIEQFFSPSNTDKGYHAQLSYKSITGLEAYGKPRPYVENFAESDMASVELPTNDPREQTDITLALVIAFAGDTNTPKAQQIKATDDVYHDFIDAISGAFILYYDTARQRKVLIYQSDKIDPKTDSIKGIVYKEVEIKFKNIFGRSFPITDNNSPIEKLLNNPTI